MPADLSARLETLRLYMESVHPDWRVVSALRQGETGRAHEILRPPSIRIRPPETTSAGTMRWGLEFWPPPTPAPDGKLSGADGILHAAASLRDSLHRGEAPTAYRLLGGTLARPGAGAVYWLETVEEPWNPPAFRHAAFLGDLREVAFLGGVELPGGEDNLGPIPWSNGIPAPGSALIATDSNGHVYLGAALETAPELVLASPLPRLLGPGIVLAAAEMTHRAPAPVHARFSPDRTAAEALYPTLSGQRRRRLLRPPTERLHVTLPILRRSEARAWDDFLAARRGRPSLLWGTEDARLYDAVPLRWEATFPAGETTATFACEMDVLPASSLDPHMENSQ